MMDDDPERELMGDDGFEDGGYGDEAFEDAAPRRDDLSSEDRTWAMVAHLSTLSGYVGVPLGWILGPLIVYLVKKDDSPFVAMHAREALNMGISATIYLLVSIVLALIIVGILTAIAVTIGVIVFAIIAGIKANEGRSYRYPYILRLVK